MTNPDIDDEYIPRYRRGYEWFSSLVQDEMAGKPWRRLGVFSFYDEPYVESDRMYLSPKQVMVRMGADVKRKERGICFVVDAMEKGEMGLSTRQGFDQFMEIFDAEFPGAEKYYFGSKESDLTWLHDFTSLKIPLGWLVKRPNIFAEVLSDASPVGEIVGPGDAAFEDFAGMTEVLIEKLGPPSLTEEVMGRIRSTEASEYAGEAVGLMTVFISPTTAVSRGVKYLGKFLSLMKDRRKTEVKQVYEEWEERVTTGYSEENLRKFLEDAPDYDSGLANAVENFRPVVLITETRGTIYDLFLPLVLQHLVDEIGYIPPHRRPRRESDLQEEEYVPHDEWDDSLSYEDIGDADDSDLPPIDGESIDGMEGREKMDLKPGIEISKDEFGGKPETVLFLDAATHLSKFNRSFNFALGLPEKYPNMSVAASFFTDRETVSETLEEGVLEYMKDRALVFDLHPELFDKVTCRMPVSKKAWLQGQLMEMEKIRSEGEVAFLEYSLEDEQRWILRQVEKPAISVVRDIRQWLRRGG